MGWSVGEARSLCVKAARGAGFPWGLAEEAGFAVEWLEIRGAPGLEALARCLQQMDQYAPKQAQECPITTGASISDSGSWEGFPTGRVYQPLLMAPFLGNLEDSTGVQLRWGGNDVQINSASIQTSSGIDLSTTDPVGFEVLETKLAIADSNCAGRIPTDRQPWIDLLGKFAARTYAPATEESRLSGAGAGTNDND